jgi:hypothetical protein
MITASQALSLNIVVSEQLKSEFSLAVSIQLSARNLKLKADLAILFGTDENCRCGFFSLCTCSVQLKSRRTE